MKNNSSPVLPTTSPRNYATTTNTNTTNGSKNWCEKCDGTYATLAALISHKKSCKGTLNLKRQQQQQMMMMQHQQHSDMESRRLLLETMMMANMAAEVGDDNGADDEDNENEPGAGHGFDEQSLKLMSEAMAMANNPLMAATNPLMQFTMGNDMLNMPQFGGPAAAGPAGAGGGSGAFPPNELGAMIESLGPLLASMSSVEQQQQQQQQQQQRNDDSASSPSPEEQQAALLTQQMMFFHMLQQLQGGAAASQMPQMSFQFLAAAAAAAAAASAAAAAQQQTSQQASQDSPREKIEESGGGSNNRADANLKEAINFQMSQMSSRNNNSQLDNNSKHQQQSTDDRFGMLSELEEVRRPQSAASSTSTNVSNSQPSSTQKLLSTILDLKDTNPDVPLPPMMSPPKVDASEAATFSEPNTLELLQKHTEQALQNTMSGGSFLLNGLSSTDNNDLLNFRKGKDGKEDPSCRHRCKFCGKVFGSDSALQIHIRSHTGERPFKCNVCGNRFTTKGNLKVHFQRHKAKYPNVKMNPHPVPEHLDKFHPPLEPPSNSQSPPPQPPPQPPTFAAGGTSTSSGCVTPTGNLHIPSLFSSTLIPFAAAATAAEGSPKETSKFLTAELNKSKSRNNFFDFPSLYKSTFQGTKVNSSSPSNNNQMSDDSANDSDAEDYADAASREAEDDDEERDSDGSEAGESNHNLEKGVVLDFRKMSAAAAKGNTSESDNKRRQSTPQRVNNDKDGQDEEDEDKANNEENAPTDGGDYGKTLKARDDGDEQAGQQPRLPQSEDNNGSDEEDEINNEDDDTNNDSFPFNVHLPYLSSLPGSSSGVHHPALPTSFNFMGLPFGALGSGNFPNLDTTGGAGSGATLSLPGGVGGGGVGHQPGSESPELAEAASKDPIFYQSLLPKPGSTDNAWESLMEVQKAPDAVKLQFEKIENNVNDPNQCKICQRVLSCKSALQMHYRTHTGERPFKCKICSRAFTTKGNLKTHMGVHRVKPPLRMLHQCPICHKQFTNALVLQQHLRLHAGEANVMGFPGDVSAELAAKFKNNPLLGAPFPSPFLSSFGNPFPMLGGPSAGLFSPAMMPRLDLSPGQQLVKSPSLSGMSMNYQRDFDDDSKSNLDDERSMDTKSEEENNMSSEPSKRNKTISESSEKRSFSDSVSETTELDEEQQQQQQQQQPESANKKRRIEDENSLLNETCDDDKSEKDRDEREEVGREDTLSALANHVMKSTSQSNILYTSPGASSVQSTPEKSMALMMHDGNSKAASDTSSNKSASMNDYGRMFPSAPFDGLPYHPTGRPNTTCRICNKTFACFSALEIHYRSHTKERPFKCEVCDRGFSTKGNMKQHMLTHKIRDLPPDLYTTVSPSSNTTLGNFLTSSHIAKLIPKQPQHPQHQSSNNSTNNSNNSSRVSSPPTPNGNNSNHSMDSMDNKIRNTESPAGDQSSTSSRTSGSNKHMCTLCNKPFSSGSALQIHMRTHTGDKPFKCSICGRAFTTKGNLKVHMGTHMWNSSPSRRGRRMSIDFNNIAPHLLGNSKGNAETSPLSVQQMMLMELMSKQSAEMSSAGGANNNTATSSSKQSGDMDSSVEDDEDGGEDVHDDDNNKDFQAELFLKGKSSNNSVLGDSHNNEQGEETQEEEEEEVDEDEDEMMNKSDETSNGKWTTKKQFHVCSLCQFECETDVDLEDHLKEHINNVNNTSPKENVTSISS